MFGILGQLPLSEYVAVWVPITEFNTAIQNDTSVQHVQEVMCIRFGGTTSVTVDGHWLSEETGDLVRDRVEIVFSFTSRVTDNDIIVITQLAQWLAIELSQEAIMVAINGKAYFVRPD